MSTLANVAGGEMAEVGSVDLVDVTKRFGSVAAVDGIDLTVKVGEFLSLLGPSGCGKTHSSEIEPEMGPGQHPPGDSTSSPDGGGSVLPWSSSGDGEYGGAWPGRCCSQPGYALQLRLRIRKGFQAIPFELLLALPNLVVIAAMFVSGRSLAYPGAYLKPYRRE
jgi:hypothetical protein